MKVAIAGASGETGSSVVNALLESSSSKFEIIALTRPSSVAKPENVELEKRGVKVVATDFDGPGENLVNQLNGIEVVISTLDPCASAAEITLASAAKTAGVKRFVPCSFATAAPPKGVMQLRELKENTINHIKKIYLPYTVIDVGWWYQLSIPSLPSGRTAHALFAPANIIPGDGNAPSARTDVRDIGRYVARIIADPRTLNKMVFAYGDILTSNQVCDLLERLSGEKVKRTYLPEEAILGSIENAKTLEGLKGTHQLWSMEYLHSWGIRGDNTPEHARYLGYLDAKELYPDMKQITLEEFFNEVLAGKVKAVYERKRAQAQQG